MEDFIAAEFKIYGFVQGVGFRYFVMRHAAELGLKGYAKNLYDGSVEVSVEGTRSAVEQLHKLLKTGPSRSHVESCKVIYTQYLGAFKNFNIF